MSDTYRIAEIFKSINGEGYRAGELSVFIRLAGCNLNCGYCDTAWANSTDAVTALANSKDAVYREMTADDICAEVQKTGIRNVTVTGGEPLIQPGIGELLTKLSSCGPGPGNLNAGAVPVNAAAGGKDMVPLSIEVETNGSVDIRPYFGCAAHDNIIFTLDYKLPGSGMEKFMFPGNFAAARACDSVKFVCKNEEDLLRAKDVIKKYDLAGRTHVFLSPVFGSIEPEKIVDFMSSNNMNNVKLQLQLHKIIWDPDMRGV